MATAEGERDCPVVGKRAKRPIQAGVYSIVCRPTGERYIGASKNLSQRRSSHFTRLRGRHHLNRRLQSLFDQHGESSFVWEVDELIPPGSDLESRLRKAELRCLLKAASTAPGLLLTRPDTPYRETAKARRTPIVLLREFKQFCLARGLDYQGEIEQAIRVRVSEISGRPPALPDTPAPKKPKRKGK
jgi:hypothetical protein